MPQRSTLNCRAPLLGLALAQSVGCVAMSAGTEAIRQTRPDSRVEHFIPVTSTHGNSHAEADPRALFQRARTLVEAYTATDLSGIALRIVSDSLIDEAVRAETARLVNSQFTSPSFRAHFLSDVMAEQTGTYAALFSHEQSAILVSRTLLDSLLDSVADEADVRDATLLALFIHELVHAADDARHDIQTQRTLSFRASFAQSATFEGHAQYRTRQICRERGCLSGLEALDDFMFGRNDSAQPPLPAVQAISRNILEYSYIEGERFVTAIVARPSGEQLLEQLLSTPPHDPVQILAPDSYPDTAREARNRFLIDAARGAEHPWTAGSWKVLETSPLKGVNLQANPQRRQAAIDGFTRLLTAIVAVQLYDEAAPEQPPREATLLRAANAATAHLFAQSLHENTRVPNAMLSSRPVGLMKRDRQDSAAPLGIDATLYQTRLIEFAAGDSTVDPVAAIGEQPPVPSASFATRKNTQADGSAAQEPADKGAASSTLEMAGWHTTIAHAGEYVVQISGEVAHGRLLERYALDVLARLHDNSITASSTNLSTSSR